MQKTKSGSENWESFKDYRSIVFQDFACHQKRIVTLFY